MLKEKSNPRAGMKATTEEIIAAYKETGSVWSAAKRLGMCGQSVWERLRAMQYPMHCMKWTEEEDAELLLLVGSCTIGEIARRLGRSYGTVATRISSKGIGSRFGNRNRIVKIPRGAGFDKQSIQKHTKAMDAYAGSIRQYARMHSVGLEPLINSIQRHFPEWWDNYVKTHSDLDPRNCAYCDGVFYPMTKKQEYCNRKCASHRRSDEKYFGGKRKLTIGLSEGVCQLCCEAKPSLSSHHVYGKENDPDNDYLVALCNGCHNLVELLAGRKFCDDHEKLEHLIILALSKRNFERFSRDDLYVLVEIEYYPFEDEDEDEDEVVSDGAND